MIRIENLRKTYGPVVALDGIDLTIESGGVVGILGPNGAGKTTLVETLEGLRPPTSGRVEVLGLDPTQQPRELREKIGVQLQSTTIPPELTPTEVLRLFASFYTHSISGHEVLEQVGLTEKAGALVQTLSGGQKQRLAIGMALIHQPELIVLDEPTTGLDPAARRGIHDVIRELRERKRTVLLTTHYIEEAEHLCDQVIVVRSGKVVANGAPLDLLRASGGRSTVWIETEGDFDPLPLLWSKAEPSGREGRYQRYTTEDPAAFVIALGRVLQEQQVKLVDLRLKRPTLEDVYLELVGATEEGAAGPTTSQTQRETPAHETPPHETPAHETPPHETPPHEKDR